MKLLHWFDVMGLLQNGGKLFYRFRQLPKEEPMPEKQLDKIHDPVHRMILSVIITLFYFMERMGKKSST